MDDPSLDDTTLVGAETLTVTLGEGAAPRLDKALADALPEGPSRSRIQALIAAGAVRRAGQAVTDPKAKTAPGQTYAITLPPPIPAEAGPEPIPLTILHEDRDLIVIDKPAGMVVHPAPGSPSGTLVNALLHHCGDSLVGIGGVGRPGIVHRIDKDTSGLLVVAKTERAHAGLSAQFADHSVERSYRALCYGVPDRGDPRLAGLDAVRFKNGALRIDAPIARHRTDRKRMAVVPGGRRAVTHVALTAGFGLAAHLTCRLETGRTHQIRVHLAHIGHPLLNDPVYAAPRRAAALPEGVRTALKALPGQALHAETLGFLHPTSGAPLKFATHPPPGFTETLEFLNAL